MNFAPNPDRRQSANQKAAAATLSLGTARPKFSTGILEAAATAPGAGLTEVNPMRLQELDKVLGHLDRSYGSHTIAKYLRVLGSDANADAGRVMLELPQDEFFGANPGHFQLRLSWPELTENGRLEAKVTLNYRIGVDFHNTVLMPGGGDGDSTGWSNINTASVFVDELIAHGYLAEAAIADVLTFCKEKCGQQEKATLTLTPQSAVSIQLRHTIVPVKARTGGRTITTTKAAGSDAGLGIAKIVFSGATVLPRLSSLVYQNGPAPALSMQDLLAKYGVGGHSLTNWGSAQVETEI